MIFFPPPSHTKSLIIFLVNDLTFDKICILEKNEFKVIGEGEISERFPGIVGDGRDLQNEQNFDTRSAPK